VNVTTVLDSDATKTKIGAKFAEITAAIRPRDVFVFFMAGHGKTEDGRYYFIPQNFRYDRDSAVTQQGISQDELQAWLAQIRAKKSLLLFDTCESGSLTEDKRGLGPRKRRCGRTSYAGDGRSVLSPQRTIHRRWRATRATAYSPMHYSTRWDGPIPTATD